MTTATARLALRERHSGKPKATLGSSRCGFTRLQVSMEYSIPAVRMCPGPHRGNWR